MVGKMIARILFAVPTLALAVSLPAFAKQVSNDNLIKSCEKKTIVFNKQGERVGEKVDGFCAGYLQATFHALLNSKGADCKVSEDKEPEYLLSVYQTYLKEKKLSLSESASRSLSQAFRRAFDCK
jgi:hypothetical protein